jgi:putative nucleotidyltransferase with HDIG domain
MNADQMVKWFQTNFPNHYAEMREADHGYSKDSDTWSTNWKVVPNPYHLEGDVWTHTMMVMKEAEKFIDTNPLVLWSSLLHDIGKPLAREPIHEKQRVRFIGHEGISTFLSVEVLNKTDLSISEKVRVLQLVAHHSDVFRGRKDGKYTNKFLKKFDKQYPMVQELICQVYCDSNGRFLDDGLENITKESLNGEFLFELLDTEDSEPKSKTVTVLVGLPCSGKSTYTGTFKDSFVISRDNIVEELAREQGKTYGDMWKEKCVDQKLQEVFKESLNHENVIVDKTHMTAKSRRRSLSKYNKTYKKNCVIFFEEFEELLRREDERRKNYSKTIGYNTFIEMMKNFSFPTFGEGFDSIFVSYQGELYELPKFPSD